MQGNGSEMQFCHTVLRGRANAQLFEEEIRKMKLLNMVSEMSHKADIKVLAYCLLDNELHMILHLREGQSAEDFLDGIARRFEAACPKDAYWRLDYLPSKTRLPQVRSSVHEQGFFYDAKQKIQQFRKHSVRALNGNKAVLRQLLKLHFLPVRLGITALPEDYWWCSYLDYRGRQWLPLTDPSEILDSISPNVKLAKDCIRLFHQKELEKSRPSRSMG